MRLSRRNCAVLLTVAVALAWALYLALMPALTSDILNYLLPWYNYIVEHGPAAMLRSQFANYTPPYVYLLIVGSGARHFLAPLVVIKLVSIFGTFLLAGAVYALLKVFTNRRASAIGAAGVLFLPTVVMNGPYMGQCDAIYAAFCLFGLTAALCNRGGWAMVSFGIALSFKMQTVLLAPLVIYLLLAGQVKPVHCLVGIGAAIAMMVPAWFAGPSPVDSYLLYFGQANFFHRLSMNAPNPWLIVTGLHLIPYQTGVVIGLCAGLAVTFAIVVHARRANKAGNLDLLTLALISAIWLPYVLPKMHERFFFMADILSFALAVVAPSRQTVACAVLVQLASFLSLGAFVFGIAAGPALGVPLMTGAALISLRMFLVPSEPREDLVRAPVEA